MLKKIKDSKIYGCIEFILALWGFGTIIYLILNAFGLVPAEISFIKKSEIKPRVYLYPGASVQFKADFNKVVDSDEITDFFWTLKGNDTESTIRGAQPVVVLPPIGGVYSLTARAVTREKSDLTGFGSLYIVQLEPQKTTLNDEVKIKVSDSAIESGEIEIYEGPSRSKTAVVENTSSGSFVTLSKGEELSAVGGKIFYREKINSSPASAKVGRSSDTFRAFRLPSDNIEASKKDREP